MPLKPSIDLRLCLQQETINLRASRNIKQPLKLRVSGQDNIDILILSVNHITRFIKVSYIMEQSRKLNRNARYSDIYCRLIIYIAQTLKLYSFKLCNMLTSSDWTIQMEQDTHKPIYAVYISLNSHLSSLHQLIFSPPTASSDRGCFLDFCSLQLVLFFA